MSGRSGAGPFRASRPTRSLSLPGGQPEPAQGHISLQDKPLELGQGINPAVRPGEIVV